MRKPLASLGLGLVVGLAFISVLDTIKTEAQPTPGIIDLGVPGNGVVYIGAHRLGPGSGTNSTNIIIYSTTVNVDTFNTFTNSYFTFTTNVVFNQNINVSGKAQLNFIILTNGFFSKTNTWPGPTNPLDMSIYRQQYSTLVPVKITGLINYSNDLGSEVLLSIQNNALTNIQMTYAAGIIDRDHVTQQTITNGTKGVFWIQFDPSVPNQGSNAVFNDF